MQCEQQPLQRLNIACTIGYAKQRTERFTQRRARCLAPDAYATLRTRNALAQCFASTFPITRFQELEPDALPGNRRSLRERVSLRQTGHFRRRRILRQLIKQPRLFRINAGKIEVRPETIIFYPKKENES